MQKTIRHLSTKSLLTISTRKGQKLHAFRPFLHSYRINSIDFFFFVFYRHESPQLPEPKLYAFKNPACRFDCNLFSCFL